MKIVRSILEMRNLRKNISGTVGFVTTLGGLHDGHKAHLNEAKTKSDILIASSFLNPLQFSAKEDIYSYPINEENDLEILRNNGVDYAFLPTKEDMYQNLNSTLIDPGDIANVCEGKSRPGHFIGVATIVVKLFNIIEPNFVTFGQKDAQQLRIIKNIIKDLSFEIKIIEIPTIRDKEGLALSTRNRYLTSEEKKSANKIYQSLIMVNKLTKENNNSSKFIIEKIFSKLNKDPLITVEYIKIVDPISFNQITTISKNNLLVLAVKIGKARLIDNININTN